MATTLLSGLKRYLRPIIPDDTIIQAVEELLLGRGAREDEEECSEVGDAGYEEGLEIEGAVAGAGSEARSDHWDNWGQPGEGERKHGSAESCGGHQHAGISSGKSVSGACNGGGGGETRLAGGEDEGDSRDGGVREGRGVGAGGANGGSNTAEHRLVELQAENRQLREALREAQARLEKATGIVQRLVGWGGAADGGGEGSKGASSAEPADEGRQPSALGGVSITSSLSSPDCSSTMRVFLPLVFVVICC